MGAPSTGQGSTDVDLCAPQPLETTNWVTGCMKSNCSTPEALFTQNATLRACGIEPRMERQWLPVMTTFMILAFISVVLRVANRLYTTKTYWWDDIFLSLSMVCYGEAVKRNEVTDCAEGWLLCLRFDPLRGDRSRFRTRVLVSVARGDQLHYCCEYSCQTSPSTTSTYQG